MTPGHAHHHHHRDAGDMRLLAGIAVNGLLTVVQIVGGLISGSLALVADALHNLNDAAALALALVARRIARKPADRRRTFGYRKAEAIGALVNTTALLLVAAYLVYQAVMRAISPQVIDGWIVVGVAALAFVVDLFTALLTRALARDSINVRAAFVHNLSDALGSLAVMVTGVLVLVFGWTLADVVATLLIAGYIAWMSVGLLRDSIRLLLDSAPTDVSLDDLTAAMTDTPGVVDVHHVHLWQLDEQHRALEAHVVVEVPDLLAAETVKHRLKSLLAERFAVDHTALELEIPDTCLEDPERCWVPPGAE
jgi:cobalt-zinc-cadmium efflux system protein